MKPSSMEKPTIDLYYWTTPNGHKITLFLEEAGIDYNIKPININKGDQFAADFLSISPNNRIPAIVDHQPTITDEPFSLFESGAILEYLADKTGLFLPAGGVERYRVLEWLYWQMGGLGPMAGQNHHFSQYAPEKIPYAIERYVNETNRLYGVLDRQLAERPYIAGDDYTIADMAIWPWYGILAQGKIYDDAGTFLSVDDYTNVQRWQKVLEKQELRMLKGVVSRHAGFLRGHSHFDTRGLIFDLGDLDAPSKDANPCSCFRRCLRYALHDLAAQ